MAAKWIAGKGFMLVQHSKPLDAVENKKNMDLLEKRLREAEFRLGLRKESSSL